MVKIKGGPGPYVPFDQIVQLLKNSAYGALDLVDLGLFHSEHFVRDAITSGKLKSQKINKRAVVFCREDLLHYWQNYRSTPYEVANNSVEIKLTISEVDFLSNLVLQGQKRVNKEFSKDDLFRNIINHLKQYGCSIDNQPQLFEKR